MERIAKIIRVVSERYDIDMVDFVTKQTSGKQRLIPYRTLCYLCFESFKKRRTTLGIKKLSQFLCISEKLILEAHELTKLSIERNTNEARNIYALMRTVNKKYMTIKSKKITTTRQKCL